MDIDPEQARKLCSEAEFELFTESRDDQIITFTAEGLKRRAYQAQKLFDLWGGRVSEQQSAGWGKVGEARKKAATGYITARQKAELFEDVWKRFDARLKVVLKDPNLVVKDFIRQRKTGKVNKGGELSERPTGKVRKSTGRLNSQADEFARPAGQPLNKPKDQGADPNRVWI